MNANVTSQSLLPQNSDLLDEEYPGFLISDVARMLTVHFDRRISATGLTRAQWRAIVYLLRNDGLTQTELADVCQVERATMGGVLDRLEASDFIVRKPDPDDRRVRRVYILRKGLDLVPFLSSESKALKEQLFAGVSRQDKRITLRCLAQMRDNLT